EKSKWIEWLCHTNFSFLTGASHPHEYVNRAYKLGYGGIGITDYDGFYGIVRAYKAARDIEKKGMMPPRIFYGCEIHLAKDHDLPILYQNTISLLALSRNGYGNISGIISYSHRNGKRDACISLEKLATLPLDDIVCIYPMRGLLRRGEFRQWRAQCEILKELFKDRFYMAVSSHRNPSEDIWIPEVIRISKNLSLQTLFTQDAYFHAPSAKIISDLLHAIRLNRDMGSSVGHMFVNDERSLREPDILWKRYSKIPDFPQSVKNSIALSERFNFCLSELCYHYPDEMIPNGYTAQSFLEKITMDGATARYGDVIPGKVKDLLLKELSLIRELEFADYFLTVWDIVRWARSRNILCQGRGSAANSAVCFVLGITSVDPCYFDLLFERFISVERGDPPDIDVDFEHERREEVIQHIYDHYGRQRAAMVANVVTFRCRSAIRLAGKALGIPNELLARASELQETREYRWGPARESINVVKTALPDKEPKIPWELWAVLSEKIKGFPHHMGIHTGGFILSDEPMDRLCPQEPATMEGRSVIQWSKEDIETLKFFKIDILSLGMLTAIRKSFDLISSHCRKSLSLAEIPPDDPKTYSMIQKAHTVGAFQIESRAQMSMLPRLKPKSFYDLVVQVGIIRPGPIHGGLVHPYLRRRNGLEPVIYADPRLEPVLKRTLGVPIFQEQVMRIAMTVGGFSPGEADEFRRHIGSWSVKEDFAPFVDKLALGMRKNRINEYFIKQTIEHLKGFADYGFPESHAVSFALLAYASAYLKCHYPEIFFTSLLNSQPLGFYSIHALIHTAIREGISVLPICINNSNWDNSLEKRGDSHAIRLGYRLIRGFKKSAASHLLKEREIKGSFKDIESFLRESTLYRGDMIRLASAGAFEIFGIDRRSAIWIAEAAPFAPLLDDEDLSPRFPEEDRLR
ncbi:MAG: error-prone DNA polymerase, partial [Oligoflexales bacterium]|nr:error-prone DNA polymerase [Oligoflexales bacterium]